MAAARKVTVYVHAHVRDKDGNITETVVLAPGDPVPAGADLGPQCFVKPDKGDAADDSGDDSGDDGGGDKALTKVDDIVAAVGDDKALAQEYLDKENAADKPRKTLVEKLQAIVAAEA